MSTRKYKWQAKNDLNETVEKWGSDSPPSDWLSDNSDIQQSTIRVIDRRPNRQNKVDSTATTTTSESFQTKLSLTIPDSLQGNYLIFWHGIVHEASASIEIRLYNSTDNEIIGKPFVLESTGLGSSQRPVTGYAEYYFLDNAKTFEFQFRSGSSGSAVGLNLARIDLRSNEQAH